MKVLVTSISAIYNEESEPYSDIIEVLLDFHSRENCIVVVLSRSESKVELAEECGFLSVQVSNPQSADIIDVLKDVFETDSSEIVFLVTSNAYLFMSSNAKLVKVIACYSETYANDEILQSKAYGIEINNANDLNRTLNMFLKIKEPSWFINQEVNDEFRFMALTDANTHYVPREQELVNIRLLALLKSSEMNYFNVFFSYYIFCLYKHYEIFEEVDYWTYFPSSDGEPDTDLEKFVRLSRSMFKKRKDDPIFIRNSQRKPSKTMSKQERLELGAAPNFDTITINPVYSGKLRGKVVCVIDDYSTYGATTSTVYELLNHVGIKKLIFIAIGKYGGSQFYRYSYSITGDVYEEYNHAFIQRSSPDIKTNDSATRQFINCLTEVR